jgi:hypothetical protein
VLARPSGNRHAFAKEQIAVLIDSRRVVDRGKAYVVFALKVPLIVSAWSRICRTALTGNSNI